MDIELHLCYHLQHLHYPGTSDSSRRSAAVLSRHSCTDPRTVPDARRHDRSPESAERLENDPDRSASSPEVHRIETPASLPFPPPLPILCDPGVPASNSTDRSVKEKLAYRTLRVASSRKLISSPLFCLRVSRSIPEERTSRDSEEEETGERIVPCLCSSVKQVVVVNSGCSSRYWISSEASEGSY